MFCGGDDEDEDVDDEVDEVDADGDDDDADDDVVDGDDVIVFLEEDGGGVVVAGGGDKDAWGGVDDVVVVSIEERSVSSIALGRLSRKYSATIWLLMSSGSGGFSNLHDKDVRIVPIAFSVVVMRIVATACGVFSPAAR